MRNEHLPTDHIEERRRQINRLRSRLDAEDLALLAELDRRQVATRDGCRTLSEWVSATDDISVGTARRRVRTMRRLQSKPTLDEHLLAGEISFERAEALSKISEDAGLMRHLDLNALQREVAKRESMDRADEMRSAADNFLFFQFNLDQTWSQVRGGLDGVSASLVDSTLSELADQQPDLPDGGRGDRSWRRATALVQLCASGEPVAPPNVTVFVDGDLAASSNGEAGVMLESRGKVGVNALQAILCEAVTGVTVNSGDGVPMAYGRRTRTVPPALRRAVIHRDREICAIDGCGSSYRLEAHHLVSWSEGGNTDASNLAAVCWFHHHIVIHQRGFVPYRHLETGRLRLRRTGSPPKPPPIQQELDAGVGTNIHSDQFQYAALT